MDLHEAAGLLGLQQAGNLQEKDVEKSFRKKALLHHPDKGGNAAHFQLLHRAKDRLLEHIDALGSNHYHHHFDENNNNNNKNKTNYRSLYQSHRACVRQVLTVDNLVVAATDEGLVVMTMESNQNCGVPKRVVNFCQRSFLCCCCADKTLYAGSKDGHVHRMDISTREWSSWKLMQGFVVAISAIRNFVAVASANGSLSVLEFQDHSRPTIVWNYSLGMISTSKKSTMDVVSPETILLEKGSSPNGLNLWVGGGNNGSCDGRLLLWKFDTESDFWERFETEDLFDEYDFSDSDMEDSSSEDNDKDDDSDPPAINLIVNEGPIFSLSKHNSTITVSSGQCIRIWNYKVDITSPHGDQLVETQTIQTNNKTLYALCLNERFLAAAGSNESITVWNRDDWTIINEFRVPKTPDGCCLATNCVMTLAWFLDGGLSESLVSGGYDGVVTLWTIDSENTSLIKQSSHLG